MSNSLRPHERSPPGSSVHGISQARVLEWVAISFSRGSSWPRDRTCASCISCTGRWILYHLSHLGSPCQVSKKKFIIPTATIYGLGLKHITGRGLSLLLLLEISNSWRAKRYLTVTSYHILGERCSEILLVESHLKETDTAEKQSSSWGQNKIPFPQKQTNKQPPQKQGESKTIYLPMIHSIWQCLWTRRKTL